MLVRRGPLMCPVYCSEVKRKEAEFLSILLFIFLFSFGTTFEQFGVD